MKFLFDLLPIILFFVSYQVYPEFGPKSEAIYFATGVAIAATFAQIAWVHFRHGKVDRMLWVSLAIIVTLGGATLLFHDKTFIMWKPTVLYWVFALALLLSPLLFKKNLIKLMMEKQITAPEQVWGKLNLSWALFFTVMGFANLYVAFNFSEATWVKFKMFGTLGLMFVFVMLQGLMLSKYIEDKETE